MNIHRKIVPAQSCRDFGAALICAAVALMLSLTAFSGEGLAYPRTPDDLIEISCGTENPEGKKILIAYDTIHGSTAEVAQFIGGKLCDRGFQVDVLLAVNVSDLEGYDAVIIGSAVYQYSWLPDALGFLEAGSEALAQVPVALFIVCAAMQEDTPENRQAAQEAFIDPVLESYPEIEPLSVGLFGGAVDLNTNQYTWFEKIVLRIVGLLLGYKDSADWRDWDAISEWTVDLGEQLH